jgi:hypothetical protein
MGWDIRRVSHRVARPRTQEYEFVEDGEPFEQRPASQACDWGLKRVD